MNFKILFIDSVHPSLQKELEKAGFQCDLKYDLSKEQITDSIKDYQGVIIRSKIKLTKEIIDKAVQFQFIARVGSGMENIDVEYAESKGIKCLHAPEGNRDAVAEHAIGMLLALFNNIVKANHEVRKGEWTREGNRGVELAGKTVGILGYGNMGSAFAKRLEGFNVHVLAYDKYKKKYSDGHVKECTLTELFEQTDVLSIHIPLTEESLFMINDQFINSFKKNIYIINTARGKVLKTEDLVKSMKSGKITGACLDVLEYEDVSFEKLNSELKTQSSELGYLINSSKTILTPHIAGWTHESNKKMALILAEKIKELFGNM